MHCSIIFLCQPVMLPNVEPRICPLRIQFAGTTWINHLGIKSMGKENQQSETNFEAEYAPITWPCATYRGSIGGQKDILCQMAESFLARMYDIST